MRKSLITLEKTSKLRLLWTLILAAAICALTSLLSIPFESTGAAYLHVGDILVFASPVFLGPLFGALASAMGCGAADLIVGAHDYVLVTVLIKAATAALIWFALKKSGTHNKLGDYMFPLIAAAVFGSLCYFFYNLALHGFWNALLCFAFDLLQGLGCGLISIPFIRIAEAKGLKTP